MDVLHRNNVRVTGRPDGPTVVLAHGFGCDQNLWRLVVPALAQHCRLVLLDYVGSGRSDLSAWSEERYSSLHGYARDVTEICDELDLRRAVLVGHSVSAMVGVLAAERAPERIGALVMVAPSPRYIDDDGYVGGFSAEDIDELLASLESNYLGWSAAMAPVIWDSLYGDDALRAFAADHAPVGPDGIITALRDLLGSFGDGLTDDTALLAVGVPASPPTRTGTRPCHMNPLDLTARDTAAGPVLEVAG